MSELSENFPRYCKLYDAKAENPNIIDTYCGESLCEHKYMILTDFDASEDQINSLPQVLFLGSIHGNEVLGANILINLAEYLLENIENPDLGRMLKSRYIILLPMANPSGFYLNQREEQQVGKSIDPNRDFPYNKENDVCFVTAAARVVNHLYRKYLIQAAITFHGGQRAIGYPWGAYNHIAKYVYRQPKAEESPDDKIFADIGKILSKEAGSNPTIPLKQYPVNKMTDIVYPVDGGMEDWAYAASWESKYNPGVINTCSKNDEKVKIPISEVTYGPESVKSLVYLVETADEKMPEEAYLGTSEGLQDNKVAYGHIPMNINLCLALADLVQPYVKVKAVQYDEVAKTLTVQWQGGGCKTVTETYLEWNNTEKGKTFSKKLASKQGPGYYENKDYLYEEKIKLNNTNFQMAFTIKMTCDQNWATQVDPKPLSKIQTHVANSRTNQNYYAESNGFKIFGSRVVEYTQENIIAADFVHERTVDLKDIDLEILVTDCSSNNYGRINAPIVENGDAYLMTFEGSLAIKEKPVNAFLHQYGDLSRCKDSMGFQLNPNTYAVLNSKASSVVPLFQSTEKLTSDGQLTVSDSRTIANEADLQQLVGRSVHFESKDTELSYVGQILPVQPASCKQNEEMTNCFGTDIGQHSAICNVQVTTGETQNLIKLIIDAGVPGESITIDGFVSNAIIAHYGNPNSLIVVNEKIQAKLSLDQNQNDTIHNYYQIIKQGTMNMNPQFALGNVLRVYVDQGGQKELVGNCSIVRRDTMFDEKAYLNRPGGSTLSTVDLVKPSLLSWLLLGLSIGVGVIGILYIIRKYKGGQGSNDNLQTSAAGFGRAVGQHIELAEAPEEGTDI